MAISLTDRVRIPEDVLLSNLQSESVILNLKTERYFGLDDVGTRFLTALNESESIHAAHQTLLKEFDVDGEVLRQDLLSLIEQLLQQGIIEVSTAQTSS